MIAQTVSVVIPCYNRADYIAETVESVLNQTYQNIELIIVDDGCTDNSREILEQYKDHITILEHPGRVNKGQSAAINLGLSHATGNYIAILDSDDLFKPEKIAAQVRYLEDNPNVGTVYANGMNITAEGKPTYMLYPEGDKAIIGPEPVLEHCAFNLPSNALVRKSVFVHAGFFDETLRTAQDHDMAIRIAEVAPVGYINQCLWSYRRHGNSISKTRTMERWQNGFKILEAARQRYPYSQTTIKRRLAVLHFRLGQCRFQEKKYLAGLINFIKSAVYDPLRAIRVMLKIEKISSPNS